MLWVSLGSDPREVWRGFKRRDSSHYFISPSPQTHSHYRCPERRAADQRLSSRISPCWLLLIHCHKCYLDFIIGTRRETRCVQSKASREQAFHSLLMTTSIPCLKNRYLRPRSTCLSDLSRQVELSSLPLILTQINIKLNTRPCSVNFMWLRMIGFLLRHTARIKEHERLWELWSPSGTPFLFPSTCNLCI